MNETAWGLWLGLVVNLTAAAFLNNTFWEPTTRTWLVTLGTANELLGLLLVASPELIPRLLWARRGILDAARRFSSWLAGTVRHVFGRRRHIFVDASSGGGIGMAGGGTETVIRNPPPNSSTQELVAWLIERDRTMQLDFQRLEVEVRKLPEQWRSDIEETRRKLEGLQQVLVRQVADARIRLRLLGVGYIVIALVLTWCSAVA